jgi:hypothetical protein
MRGGIKTMDPQTITLITAVVAGLTGSGITGLIQFFITRHDRRITKKENADSAQSMMLLGLGHDKILSLTDQFVNRGGITLKEKRNLDYLYKPYVRLNGNGDCKIGYDACQELEVISEDRAKELDTQIKRKFYGFE